MTNLTSYPLQDWFETTLAQSWNGAVGTVYLNTAPSFTFPSGVTTYIVVNPWKTSMQVAEIDSYDSVAKTVNVTSVTIEKWASINYSATTHAVGSKVIISDNYAFWKDIADSINSKVNKDVDSLISDNVELQFGSTSAAIYTDDAWVNMKFKDGSNPAVTLSTLAAGAGADTKVSVTINDTTPAVLDSKVLAGDGLTKSVGTPSGNETLDLDIDTTDTTVFVKTSSGAWDEDKVPVLNASGQLASWFIDWTSVVSAWSEALVDKDTYRLWEPVAAWESLFAEEWPDWNIVINTADSHGVSMAQSWVTTVEQWVRFTPKNNIQIKTVTKDSSCDATRAVIRDDIWGWTLISSATFSWNVATFWDVVLLKWIVYRILADSNWSSYTWRRKVTADVVYPILWTNIEYISWYNAWTVTNQIWNIATITSDNIKDITTVQNIWDAVANTRVSRVVYGSWVAWNTLKLALRKFTSPWVNLGVRIETDNAWVPSGTLAHANATATVTAASLTTSLVDTTVTLAGSITLTEWTKYHIVLFAGTYGAETINATNYFGVGYSTNNTTTRKTLEWDGTSRLQAYAATVTDADNLTFTSTNAAAAARWYRMQAREDLYLTTITKSATSNATRVQIKSDAWANLATYSFSWNIATLTTPLLFTKDQYFRLECDNNSSSYTSHRLLSATFPQNRTNVNYISGSEDWSSAGASGTTAFNIDSVGTALLINIFTYASSTLFSSTVLSKTDAKYSYKLPTDVPRIATESKSTGENVIATTFWYNSNQTGLTALTDYYLADTPWAISATPWTNRYQIGKSVNDTIIEIWGKVVFWEVSLSNNTVYTALESWIVVAYWSHNSWATLTGYSDTVDWSTTIVASQYIPSIATVTGSITFVVRKWYLYKVNMSAWTLTSAKFYPISTI